ncbi:hypothetical protein AM587_10002195 [Phytophthora nicotianae]|uniref:Uncharacterized protein n=1 Tax=Phytophthora nicotianae TaxID=4792 RepID=A0A0W8C4K9_PHYNI|nr:hypothetical protein AM587_10001133 [Phytophthora nicotianae]KUF88966.1 hypothetical protein AM587_10002195 [Phytophthora nicotianae]
MVFRFTNDQDKVLMRVQINVKQIRDRLTLLKGMYKNAEAAAARGSGIEESVDAVNVQSHYDERERLAVNT